MQLIGVQNVQLRFSRWRGAGFALRISHCGYKEYIIDRRETLKEFSIAVDSMGWEYA